MTQLITPNPNIPCTPGWCLQYVRQTYGLPARYGSATEAWEKSATQHRDRNFPPGLWVPVWFSIDTEPNGHVALLTPDGTVYSSSDLGSTPHLHPDIDELIAYYAYWGKMQLTYLGWTEDVAGFPVVSVDAITAQSDTITPLPVQEDTLSQAEVDQLYSAMMTRAAQTEENIIAAVAKAINDAADAAPVRNWSYTNPNIPGGDAFQRLRDIPAQVLNQTFKLADGTVTNLAGILTAIHATPTAGTPADPVAVVHALRDQLNK